MLWALIGWVVFGGIVGLIARAIMPGKQSMGFLATVALGVAGSFIGGLLASFLFGHGFSPSMHVHPVGWIGSVLGALVLLFVVGLARRGGKRK